MEADKIGGYVLTKASDEQQNDGEFVIKAVKRNGMMSLESASEFLGIDREKAMKAVKRN